MENWLDELKPGDAVIVNDTSVCGPRATVRTVTRVTKTIIFVGGTRFKKSGSAFGGLGYYASFLTQATPEAVASVKEQEAKRLNWAEAKKWFESTPPAEQVAAVVDVIRNFASTYQVNVGSSNTDARSTK